MPPKEIIVNLYCPDGIQCEKPCLHGPNWAQKAYTDAVYEEKFDTMLAIGGFRSGKTSEAARIGIDLAIKYPGNKVLFTRKYSNDFKATFAVTIEEAIPPSIIIKRPTIADPYYVIRTRGRENSQLWCLGLYGTDRKRIGKLKGAQFGAILVDQAEEINRDDLHFLQARLSMRSIPYRPLLLYANPPNEGHDLHTYFEVEKNRHNCRMFSFPTEANRHYIPDGYIEKLIEEYKDRPGWLRCYLEGKWGYVALGDSAYHGFLDATHVMKRDHNPHVPVLRCWDYGWKHPAVGWYQQTDAGGIHKFAEDLGNCIDIREYTRNIIRETNKRFPGLKVEDYGDHAGTQKSDKDRLSSIEIQKQEFGIDVRSRPSISIEAGVSLLQKYITLLLDGRPGFTADPSCRITIDGIQGGYSRDKELGEIIKDGFFEHIMDTDRYVFWNLFANEAAGALKRAREVKIRMASYGFGGGARPVTVLR